MSNIASLMMHKMRPHPTNSNGRGPQHGPHLGQEHLILSGDCSLNLAILVLTKKVTYVAQPCPVAALIRTGRRMDRRPCGILSFVALYRLRFGITTFRVGLEDCPCLDSGSQILGPKVNHQVFPGSRDLSSPARSTCQTLLR